MLQNYIQTLKDLYERLSQQNLNTPADILTAWKLTAQIMLASIVPVLIIVTAIAAHVYLYKIILRKFYLKREAALEVGLYHSRLRIIHYDFCSTIRSASCHVFSVGGKL